MQIPKEEQVNSVFSTVFHGRERVLLCLPHGEQSELCRFLTRKVQEFGGTVELWRGDFRWKALLKLAFSGRAAVVIGSPHIVLGLRKVAKATNTPLFIRHAVLLDPSSLRMREDLSRSLDCCVWDLSGDDPEDDVLSSNLLPWSSVLDYRVAQTPFGMDLEIVVFPGEKLPPLPSCAKMTIRSWEPEKDTPFLLQK